MRTIEKRKKENGILKIDYMKERVPEDDGQGAKRMIALNILDFLKNVANDYGEKADNCSCNESEKRTELLKSEKHYRKEYRKIFRTAKKLFKDNPEALKKVVPEWAKDLIK